MSEESNYVDVQPATLRGFDRSPGLSWLMFSSETARGAVRKLRNN